MAKIHNCLLLDDRGRIRCIRKADGRFAERSPGREYTLSEASSFWAWWKESESYDEDADEVVDVCIVSADEMWKTLEFPVVLAENTSWKLQEVEDCLEEYGERGRYLLSYLEGQTVKKLRLPMHNYSQDEVAAEIWIPSGDHCLAAERGSDARGQEKLPSGRESDIHRYYRDKREHERKL